MFKYFGIYPISVWYMHIHCDNCSYEGRAKVDPYHYGFFILSTLFVLGTYSIFGFKVWMGGTSRTGLISTLSIYGGYLVYFFRPQKYHCPQCKGKYGTPLAFHRALNP